MRRWSCFATMVAASLCAGGASAQPARTTYANPLDIDYRYNFEQQHDGLSYRTGADPAFVLHKGKYYLFQTLADGYWSSDDLLRWRFITPSLWSHEGVVAPATLSDGDRLILMPSQSRPGPIYNITDPERGTLVWLNRQAPMPPNAFEPGWASPLPAGKLPPGPWDPGLFKDDDGRYYLYWGSSNTFPLYASEVTSTLAFIGEPARLFTLDPDRHGWERFGQDHVGTIAPFMEGAWMNKVGGRYYLQYGAPGTEYNAYANGTYVADQAMGPFTSAPYNPVAYKPGGFVQGAGHGSTFADKHGNYWNSGTPWLGNVWPFERRIGLWPAKFEADGQMWVNTRFGDFPHYVPQRANQDPFELFTGWMLLSYRKPVVASSTMANVAPIDAAYLRNKGQPTAPNLATDVAGRSYGPESVTDENPRTFWVAADTGTGQTLTMDLGGVKTIRAIQVNFAEYNSNRFADAPDIYTEFTLEGSVDGTTWRKLADCADERRDRPNAYFEVAPTRARFVRYVHGHIGGANLAISDFRVFGSAGGRAPAAPRGFAVTRQADGRNAIVSWQAVRGAVGYNIRWGIAPDRLFLTYQVWSDVPTQKEIRALNLGQDYYVAIESFDENGVSRLSDVKHVP